MGFIGKSGIYKGYVFYSRLLETHPDLGRAALNAYQHITNDRLSIYEKQAETLRSLAHAEAAKEMRLIAKYFPSQKLNIDPNEFILNKEILQQIYTVINNTINVKENYERNISRMFEGNQSQVDVTRFFLGAGLDKKKNTRQVGYFEKALKRNLDSLQAEILDVLDKSPDIENPELLRATIGGPIERCIYKSIREGLIEMFNSQDLTKNDSKRSLTRFVTDLENLETKDKNRLINQIYKDLELHNLKDAIAQYLVDSEDFEKDYKKMVFGPVTKTKQFDMIDTAVRHSNTKSQTGQLSGFLNETVNAFMQRFSVAAETGNKLHVTNVGRLNAKADIISGFNIDTDLFTEYFGEKMKELEKQYSSKRKAAIDAMRDANKLLKKAEGAYLIFQNAKSYDLGTLQKYKGFSAGEPFTLEQYRDILMRIPGPKDISIIGAAAQVVSRSSGTKKQANMTFPEAAGQMATYKHNILSHIAADVAYFLFDDFVTIGDETTKGATVLHIMNLNGIFVPLSYILYNLADALEKAVRTEIDNLVAVRFYSTGTVLYPHDGKGSDSGLDKWKAQREEALTSTKIKVNFLKNFRQIIQELTS